MEKVYTVVAKGGGRCVDKRASRSFRNEDRRSWSSSLGDFADTTSVGAIGVDAERVGGLVIGLGSGILEILVGGGETSRWELESDRDAKCLSRADPEPEEAQKVM